MSGEEIGNRPVSLFNRARQSGKHIVLATRHDPQLQQRRCRSLLHNSEDLILQSPGDDIFYEPFEGVGQVWDTENHRENYNHNESKMRRSVR